MRDQERVARIIEPRSKFARDLGIRVISVEADQIEAEVEVSEAMINRNGVMHGGALMAIADEIGGMATFIVIDDDRGTTTMESKTSFFRAIQIGDRLKITTTPLHKGRRTIVWQTKFFRGDGKLAAVVSQTQMIF